jgi:hypothetical protein
MCGPEASLKESVTHHRMGVRHRNSPTLCTLQPVYSIKPDPISTSPLCKQGNGRIRLLSKIAIKSLHPFGVHSSQYKSLCIHTALRSPTTVLTNRKTSCASVLCYSWHRSIRVSSECCDRTDIGDPMLFWFWIEESRDRIDDGWHVFSIGTKRGIRTHLRRFYGWLLDERQ